MALPITISRYTRNQLNADLLAAFHKTGLEIREKTKPIISWSDQCNIPDLIDEMKDFLMLLIHENDFKGRLIAYQQNQIGFIGWYECDPHPELANELIQAAISHLKAVGCTKVVGPVNGSTWFNYRFILKGEYPLFPGEPFQPDYYLNQWYANGFTDQVYYTSDTPPKSLLKPTSKEITGAYLRKNGLILKSVPKTLDQQLLEKLYTFYHETFEQNPLFNALSWENYLKISTKSELVVDYDHSFLLADEDENIAFIILSYRDIYGAQLKENNELKDFKNQRLIIKTLATHPSWQNKKIGTIMVNLVHNLAYQNGYEEIMHAVMFKGNLSAIKSGEKFKAAVAREYVLLGKEI